MKHAHSNSMYTSEGCITSTLYSKKLVAPMLTKRKIHGWKEKFGWTMWGKRMLTKNQGGIWHLYLWNGCESYRLCLPFIFIRWMQDWAFHYCDKTMFFSWVPFIQMYTMINNFFNLLIETWIKINNFIMKTTMWSFIDKKPHSMGLLKLKNIDWSSN